VKVLFGGSTSERQVSLMSGTNVWLKLRSFPELTVEPFLLAPTVQEADLQSETPATEREVWALPYAAVLRHTVEEVVDGCESALRADALTRVNRLRSHVVSELERAFSGAHCTTSGHSASDVRPLGSINPSKLRRLFLRDFVREAQEENAVVFLAVHGGVGEDGTLQVSMPTARCRLWN
jgi:D-alanine-D-alanine ligase-like ATP-grasp enzyme